MLMSGRWCFAFIFLIISATSMAKGRHFSNPADQNDLAKEQEKAFSLSNRGKAMPSAAWFVTSAFDQSSSNGPIESRWISSPPPPLSSKKIN